MSHDKCLVSDVAEHIARAASRLFAAKGYDATPVRTIVEAAGVTKPTLYYHFKSKEGLAQALVTEPLARLVEALRENAERPGDPVERVERALETQFAFCREDPDRARFVYALLFGPLGSGLAAELARFGEDIDRMMVASVRPLAAAGVVAEGRVEDCASACRGMIVISTMDFLYAGKDLGPGLARRLVGELLHGFASAEVSGAVQG